MQRITTVGKNLIAAALGNGPKLEITRFVLANIAGLDHTVLPAADEQLPSAENIVVDRAPTKAGYVDDDRVAYSLMLDSTEGDFDFNWLGICAGDDLVMVAYIPTASKFKTVGTVSGNVLSRNMVIKCQDITTATAIDAPAESWMFDFNAYIAELIQRIDGLEQKFNFIPISANANAEPNQLHTFEAYADLAVSLTNGQYIEAVISRTLDINAGNCRLVCDVVAETEVGSGSIITLKDANRRYVLRNVNGVLKLW